MHMHMRTHGCQMMVIENSKTTNFWTIFLDQFLLQHVSILNSNPIYQHNVFCWQVLFKRLKNQRYSHPCRPFLLENGLIMISKLRHWYNFLQWQVCTYLYGRSHANEYVFLNMPHICLDIHHFCSIDNWLCNPISKNWQFTLCRLELSNVGVISVNNSTIWGSHQLECWCTGNTLYHVSTQSVNVQWSWLLKQW